MRKVVVFLLLCCILAGCSESLNDVQQQSKIVATIGTSAEFDAGISTKGVYKGSIVSDEEILFTGDDIDWFNSKTRELKFKNIVPDFGSIPSRSLIEIHLDGEKLFTCVHVTKMESGVYYMVLLYDYDEKSGVGTYYLNDYYPFNWDPEGVEKDRQERAAGWVKFLDQLKEERKLK